MDTEKVKIDTEKGKWIQRKENGYREKKMDTEKVKIDTEKGKWIQGKEN
jgi:hypothetical protein